MAASTGRLHLVLHAHLPWVFHPELTRCFEEQWLFEAITESYLPLLVVMDGWEKDDVPWRISLSVSPTLLAMLQQPELRRRCTQYLEDRLALLDSAPRFSCVANEFLPALEFLRHFYRGRLNQWLRLKTDIPSEWLRHARTGRLSLLTGPATHPILPLLRHTPDLLMAQLAAGNTQHLKVFNLPATGWWMPECAYARELDQPLRSAGCVWSVVSETAFRSAHPKPAKATFAPVQTPGGLILFPRDPMTARRIWSRTDGYPGDPRYREFHRDLGWDTREEDIRPFLPCDTGRVPTGIKIHSITGAASSKNPYQPNAAQQAVRTHVEDILRVCREHCHAAIGLGLHREPILTMAFDAELFGHWWFEGPAFLDGWMRGAKSAGLTWSQAEDMTDGPLETVEVPESSWGEGGHWRRWMDESNADTQIKLRELAYLWKECERDSASSKSSFQEATRHLFLAQASDWPFLIQSGTAGAYPRRRFAGHVIAARERMQRKASGKTDSPGVGSPSLAEQGFLPFL